MLKCFNYDIVCQEIPDEVTLAVNISGCPIRCPGCHSKWLWEDRGDELNEETVGILMKRYGADITCFCFMGGDAEPEEVLRLANFLKSKYPKIKTGWYSGRSTLPDAANAVSSHASAVSSRTSAVSLRTSTGSIDSSSLSKSPFCKTFDYIKLGPYKEECGGLRSPKTNQRLFKISNGAATILKFSSKNTPLSE
ncbi:MAG: anaerobic ribonucleoside-triphosphate reductase activating protein [Bacteroidales bacterium]|jgi:anaerobic ribonucleoside-triphosphate reductase activating protein|nr:anaerobic ribonucleoside-triphosphate reductase activating protein [Bacteroidales bacterium]MCI1732952.1 anaerobic ribonucleoside-triphosphate reductase activating protein [Bacteroidales bacterium]